MNDDQSAFNLIIVSNDEVGLLGSAATWLMSASLLIHSRKSGINPSVVHYRSTVNLTCAALWGLKTSWIKCPSVKLWELPELRSV